MNHDGGYHLLFSHPEMVEDLLRRFVAEPWVADLDFTGLERVNARLHADSLDRRDGDLIFRVPLRGGGEVYLYLLLEFQSRNDRFMALRVLVYVGLLYQHLVREGRLTRDGRLPPVFPLVLYNGEEVWRAPRTLSDLIALPGTSELSSWQPEQRYYLLDEHAFGLADPLACRTLVEVLFALETNRDRDRLPTLVERLVDLLEAPGLASLRRAFETWLREVRLPALGVTIDPATTAELSEVRIMLADQVKRWEAELRREGRQEGRQEGLRLGEAKIVRRLLVRRFGPLPEWAEQRLAAADSATLEEWSLRILEADDLEDVFHRI